MPDFVADAACRIDKPMPIRLPFANIHYANDTQELICPQNTPAC